MAQPDDPDGAAGALFTFARTRGGSIALREKTAWLGLIVSVAIGHYLFDEFRDGGWHSGVGDGSAGDALIAIVVMFILQGIAIGIIEKLDGAEILDDERDTAIQQRGDRIANVALQYLLIGAIIAMGVFARGWPGWESSVATAHVLIGILIAADIVSYGSILWLYRFGRS